MINSDGIYKMVFVIVFNVLITNVYSQYNDWKPGDLLFQDLDCGELCEAIETVTKGINQSDITHVGIVDTLNGEWRVLEAVSKGVVYSHPDTFMARSTDAKGNPKVFLARLKPEFQHVIPIALTKARGYLGNPYDFVYAINDSAFYCSELVYFSYQHDGESLFQLFPMTFKPENSSSFFEPWKQYYNDLGQPIPQGKPGLNPGGISRSQELEVIKVYGYPEGWQTNDKNP